MRPKVPSPRFILVSSVSSEAAAGGHGSALDVSTDVPLHYNAECTVAPKFDAGKLVIVMTRGDRTATVTIEYTACGQYTVTRS